MTLRRCPRVHDLTEIPGDTPLEPIPIHIITTIIDDQATQDSQVEYVSSPQTVLLHPLDTIAVCKRFIEPIVYQHYLSVLPLLSQSTTLFTHPPATSPLLSPRSDYGSEYEMEEDEALGTIDARPNRGRVYPDASFLRRQMQFMTDQEEMMEEKPLGVYLKQDGVLKCYLRTSQLTSQ